MKVGIIGYGFVGRALKSGLNSSEEVCLIDPILKTTESDLIKFDPQIVFVCVPTPMNNDGSQNISILTNVLLNLIAFNINCPVVLKSTTLPSALKKITSYMPEIVYNPEFLREKHAEEDFIKSNHIVLGGSNKNSIRFVEQFYLNNTKCIAKNYVKTDLITASMIKYTINSFLATKVSFFNEINTVFKSSNANDTWSNFIEYLSYDKRLGDSHMSVPGHDGRLGFGGACLPKDSKAFIKYAESKNIELNVLNTAIRVNNNIRQHYDINKRESDQNIKFNDG